MVTRLSADELAKYGQDGFLSGIPLLSDLEVQGVWQRIDELLRKEKDNPDLDSYLYDKTHLLFRWQWDLVCSEKLLDIVEGILGPNMLMWTSSILLKRPSSVSHFTWHQDATYWGLEPPKAVTAWIAISETTPENGCVRAIPGTHRLGQLPHENTYDKNVMLLKGQRVSSPLDEDRAVDFIMRPGEVSLHDAWVVHGSGPNKSRGYRIGCSAVFIPTSVRQLGARESATLVRGRDEYAHFDLESRPNADLDLSAVEAHRNAIGRMQTYKPAKVG